MATLPHPPVDVLRGELRRALVDPSVRLEADDEGEGEEEAGVPVDEEEDVEHHLGDAEGVGEVGPGLRLVEELHHAVDAEDAVEPQDDRAGDALVAGGRGRRAGQQVGRVGGEHAQQVGHGKLGAQVVVAELGGVSHHQAVLEVT